MISPSESSGHHHHHKPVINPSDPLTQKGLAHLIQYLGYVESAEKMSDAELANAVLERVWAQMAWDEPEALLNEMMKRFEKRAGIARNEDGDIIESKTKKSK